ncbi:MAG: hypothetical protein AAB400_00125 [Patescibacteria group bacterium]
MTLQTSEQTIHARSFFVAPGIDALRRAEDIRVKQFGDDSRIATLTEIIEARVASPLDTAVWRLPYITTSTAVYIGSVKGMLPQVAVVHSVGPMATLAGAYDFTQEYPDSAFERQRIFSRLVQGEYGSVSVFSATDIEVLLGHLPSLLTYEDALNNPLVLSLLGEREYAEKYLRILAGSDANQTTPLEQRHVMPSHLGFEQFSIFDEIEFGPSAFFVRIESIGRHACDGPCTSYCSKIALHRTEHALRFVGIEGGEKITSIRLGPGDLCL